MCVVADHHQQVQCHLGEQFCGDREPYEVLRAQHRYHVMYVCMYVCSITYLILFTHV